MTIRTRIPGKIISIQVREGDAVRKGDIVAYLDAMKLENPITAPADGDIRALCAKAGDTLRAGDAVAVFFPRPNAAWHIKSQICLTGNHPLP